MGDVLTLLDKKGYKTILLKASSDPRESLYSLNGKEVKAVKLVFLANRYRMEENKAPFYIRGITW
jgi:hypothetical protein